MLFKDSIISVFPSLMVVLKNQGFVISIRQNLQIFQLLQSTPQNISFDYIKFSICPIIVKSQIEQKRFYKIFDIFIQKLIVIKDSNLNQTLDKSNDSKDNLKKLPVRNINTTSKDDPNKYSSKETDNFFQFKQIKTNNSPLVQRVKIENVPVLNFINYKSAFGQLNYKLKSQRNIIDFKKSIEETIKHGGGTVLHYQSGKKNITYLILIQRQTFQDHLSHLYNSFFLNLLENNISAERFFYYNDPRICWNEKYRSGISFENIVEEYENANLIIFGDGKCFVNRNGEIKKWVKKNFDWNKKILVSSKHFQFWSFYERILQNFFTLIPSTSDEIKLLADYITWGKFVSIRDWKTYKNLNHRFVFFRNKSIKDTLQYYFPKSIQYWIAACAIYPILSWDLTLHLGQVLSYKKHRLVTVENIFSITRLDWFREGKMPNILRKELLNLIPKKVLKKALNALVDLMKKHLMGDNVVTGLHYSFQLAIYELLLNPNDKELIKNFNHLNKQIDEPSDPILLEFLYQKRNNTFAFKIGKSFKDERQQLIKLEVGQKVSGYINNIVNFGVFVSLGSGLYGLAYKTNLTWENIGHPSERYRKHDQVEAIILRIDDEKKHIFLGLKQLQEKPDIREKLDKLGIKKGSIIEGAIKNITSFGAFVNLGNGVDGLLYITDITWGRLNHPSEVLRLNQKLNLVILDITISTNNKTKISLGLKQIENPPWEKIKSEQKYAEGDIIEGKIVNIEDYGGFLELEPGIEGLIHVTETTWKKTPVDSKTFFKLGSQLKAQISMIDYENRKISLSLKNLTPDPWERIENIFPIDSKQIGKVENITKYGVFVTLSDGIGGMIHISDLSWTKRFKHPSEFTKVGNDIEVVILDIDKKKRKLSLGHKQIDVNPWETFEKIFPTGSYHSATLVRRDDRGGIVRLPYGLEAFAPIKHIRKEDGKLANIDEELMVKVIEFNRESKRILVSHKRYLEDINKELKNKTRNEIIFDIKHQIQIERNNIGKKNLGDLDDFKEIKKTFKNKNNQNSEDK